MIWQGVADAEVGSKLWSRSRAGAAGHSTHPAGTDAPRGVVGAVSSMWLALALVGVARYGIEFPYLEVASCCGSARPRGQVEPPWKRMSERWGRTCWLPPQAGLTVVATMIRPW